MQVFRSAQQVQSNQNRTKVIGSGWGSVRQEQAPSRPQTFAPVAQTWKKDGRAGVGRDFSSQLRESRAAAMLSSQRNELPQSESVWVGNRRHDQESQGLTSDSQATTIGPESLMREDSSQSSWAAGGAEQFPCSQPQDQYSCSQPREPFISCSQPRATPPASRMGTPGPSSQAFQANRQQWSSMNRSPSVQSVRRALSPQPQSGVNASSMDSGVSAMRECPTKAAEEITKDIKCQIGAVLSEVKAEFEKLVDDRSMVESRFTSIEAGLSKLSEGLETTKQEVISFCKRLETGQQEALQSAAEIDNDVKRRLTFATEAVTDSSKGIKSLADSVKQTNDQMKGFKRSVDDTSNGIKGLRQSVGESSKRIDAIQKAFRQSSDQMGVLQGSLEQASGLAQRFEDLQKSHTLSLFELSKHEHEMCEARAEEKALLLQLQSQVAELQAAMTQQQAAIALQQTQTTAMALPAARVTSSGGRAIYAADVDPAAQCDGDDDDMDIFAPDALSKAAQTQAEKRIQKMQERIKLKKKVSGGKWKGY